MVFWMVVLWGLINPNIRLTVTPLGMETVPADIPLLRGGTLDGYRYTWRSWVPDWMAPVVSWVVHHKYIRWVFTTPTK